tara:strand:+ start:167 stop:403 length:237 start_codon:yes stop_codon:yes gene_type:complete
MAKKARRKSRRKTAKRGKAMKHKQKRRTMKKKSGKRKLNPFFKLMLDAKKKSLPSFKYNNKLYVGKKHPKLGMVYKKK